ncbi:MAG TPA: aminopeptidase [Solirubrobacteraceae bacterium]|nr:aminopeptidase [Solirubrobacteraceae bacterium]
MSQRAEDRHLGALAELIVRFGANVQPGQVVAISSEPGKEPLARAVAEAAYRAGAKFVDLNLFDIHLKRLRALHADPDTLEWVPPWYGYRVRQLGELRAATIALTGPVAPRLLRDVDAELLGKDMLPRVRESIEIVNDRTVNWTVAPSPTRGWAELVYPDLDADAALERLWEEIAHVCRLDEPDPVQAWARRMDRLAEVAAKLDGLGLDALRFEGPGTDLSVGLLPSSRWQAARLSTVGNITHSPNIPTEEVFTSPDPERVEGTVTSTKPLFTSGALITGLKVRFEGGRAVQIDADEGADTLRTLTRRDEGAARLGEVALVDRESRIGGLGTVFYDTLLDENAASHIALGQGFPFAVADPAERERINRSELHIDFMIGSSAVAVTGRTTDGREVPLLREGVWQV